MGIAYINKLITALAAGVLLFSSLSLSGCATSTFGSSLMDARAEAPGVPKASAYPSLEPRRTAPAMTADEQSKLAKELNAARNRQAPAGKARKSAAPVEPMKP
jgi:hypothetical protein